MSKDKDSKLKMGPVWDFDIAMKWLFYISGLGYRRQ